MGEENKASDIKSLAQDHIVSENLKPEPRIHALSSIKWRQGI